MTERLAEALWRAWCAKYGGDASISWAKCTHKAYWRGKAVEWIDQIEKPTW